MLINDGNGQSGHNAGNNGFWTDGRQEDGRVGKVGEVRGDEMTGHVKREKVYFITRGEQGIGILASDVNGRILQARKKPCHG